MTLLQKIQQSQTKKDLNLLALEIILNSNNYKVNYEAFKKKLAELEGK